MFNKRRLLWRSFYPCMNHAWKWWNDVSMVLTKNIMHTYAKNFHVLWCLSIGSRRGYKEEETLKKSSYVRPEGYGKHVSLLLLAWVLWSMSIKKRCSICMRERCKKGYKMMMIKRTPTRWCDHKRCKKPWLCIKSAIGGYVDSYDGV